MVTKSDVFVFRLSFCTLQKKNALTKSWSTWEVQLQLSIAFFLTLDDRIKSDLMMFNLNDSYTWPTLHVSNRLDINRLHYSSLGSRTGLRIMQVDYRPMKRPRTISDSHAQPRCHNSILQPSLWLTRTKNNSAYRQTFPKEMALNGVVSSIMLLKQIIAVLIISV